MGTEPLRGAGAEGAPHTLRVVTVGGGTGQTTLIRALRELDARGGAGRVAIDAVVAMADDGRSSGILREREGVLPPGDVRKCLVALAADPAAPLARALERRFPYLDNHSLGNLLLTALADGEGGFAAAVGEVSRALACVGRVHPSTLDDVTLAGTTAAGAELRGQAALSYAAGRLDSVRLVPAAPAANGAAVAAILDADLVVLGPGSLFTSIMPNLLVPGIAAALRETRAARLFVCPVADVPGETEGMDAEDYIAALGRMGALDMVDAALFHRTDPTRPGATDPRRVRYYPAVELSREAEGRLAARVPLVLARHLASDADCTAHDPALLADALGEVAGACRSQAR